MVSADTQALGTLLAFVIRTSLGLGEPVAPGEVVSALLRGLVSC